MQRQIGIEGLFGGAVPDQFHAHEKAPATDVPDVGMVAQRLLQPLRKACAHHPHPLQQPVAPDHVLHRQRGRAGQRMAKIGVAVLEKAAALLHGLHDVLLRHDRADGLVAAAQALGNGDEIRRHAFLFDGIQGAGPAHAAHDFVGDEQHAVTVADLADPAEIAGHGRHCAGRGAHHGFRHECHHRVGAEALDGRFQFLAQPFAVLLGGFAAVLVAIGIAGRHVFDLDEQRRKLRAPPGIAPDRQRAQRIAVIALPPRDDVAALRLADFDEILARHLQRRFHRF